MDTIRYLGVDNGKRKDVSEEERRAWRWKCGMQSFEVLRSFRYLGLRAFHSHGYLSLNLHRTEVFISSPRPSP